jgi:acyl-CoA synthetase (AMP-forming)/AMP-acid ligase II
VSRAEHPGPVRLNDEEDSIDGDVSGELWFDLLAGAAAAAPTARIASRVQELTFAELMRAATERRTALHDAGVRPTDRVLVHLDGTVDSVVLLLGSLGAARQVAIRPSSRVAGDLVGDLVGVVPGGSVAVVPPVSVTANPTKLAAGSSAPAPPGLVLFTSGTTGTPKAVVHTHLSILAGVWSTIAVQDESLGLSVAEPADDAALVASCERAAGSAAQLGLSFMSLMGLDTIAGISVLLRVLLTSADLLVPAPTFTPALALDAMMQLRPAIVGLSPFMAQGIVREQRRHPRVLAPLLTAGLGAGPCPPGLVELVEETFGGVAMVGYGLTETAGGVAMCRAFDDLDARSSTIGRATPGAVVGIADSAGMPTSPGEEGELLVATRGLCVGYEEPNVLPVRPDPAGCRWLATGDRAVLRPDGNVELRGRLSELIIRGGMNIDPVEIEQVLEEFETVARAAVFGVPSRVAGEQDVVGLVAVLGPCDVAELRRHCVSRLGARRTPSRVRIVADLPCTHDGSPRRGEARRVFLEGLAT